MLLKDNFEYNLKNTIQYRVKRLNVTNATQNCNCSFHMQVNL